MKIYILSDLHLCDNTKSQQNFIEALKFIKSNSSHEDIVVLLGDIIDRGGNYVDFSDLFLEFRTITNKIYLVPGNHDINNQIIKQESYFYESFSIEHLRSDYFKQHLDLKFNSIANFSQNYNINFVKEVENLDNSSNTNVVFVNSSLYATNIKRDNGVADYGRLWFDMDKFKSALVKDKINIVFQHHSLEYFNENFRDTVDELANNHNILFVVGHTHKNKNISYGDGVTSCRLSIMPSLFNHHDNLFGFATLELSKNSLVVDINFNQFDINGNVIPGDFFGSNSGKKNISFISSDQAFYFDVQTTLSQILNMKMQIFGKKHVEWVEPFLSRSSPYSSNTNNNEDNEINVFYNLLESSKGKIFKVIGEKQSGFTCLGYKIALDLWKNRLQTVVVLTVDEFKGSADVVIKKIKEKLVSIYRFDLSNNNVEPNVVIIDSLSVISRKASKLLGILNSVFKSTNIVVFNSKSTIDLIDTVTIVNEKSPSNETSDETNDIDADEDSTFYIYPLDHSKTYNLVQSYCKSSNHDETTDSFFERVNSYIDDMNLFRTPYNVILLMKAETVGMPKGKVYNKTLMLETVLNSIFLSEESLSYSSAPTKEMCIRIVGYFVEHMIINGYNVFDKEKFMMVASEIVQSRLLSVDIASLFDTLLAFNVFTTEDGVLYYFKSYCWLYFFAGHQMQYSKSLENHVLSNITYASFPEILDSYSNYEKDPQKLIDTLLLDADRMIKVINDEFGIEVEFAAKVMSKIRTNISDEKRQEIYETLDNSIHKKYSDYLANKDKYYNRQKSYNQAYKIVSQSDSYVILFRLISSYFIVLRNLNFVDGTSKLKLADKLVELIALLKSTIVAMAPVLVAKSKFTLGGQTIYLDKTFDGLTDEQKFHSIVSDGMFNIMMWNRCEAMGENASQVYIRNLEITDKLYYKHILFVLASFSSPKQVNVVFNKYVSYLTKNSFYLSDSINALNWIKEHNYNTTDQALKFDSSIRILLEKGK